MLDKQLYFLAFLPPEDISITLWNYKQLVANKYQSKAALRSPPHITLHMPFWWPDKKKEKLAQQLKLFCKNHHPCPINLNGFNAFPPKVIYIQVESNQQITSFQYELCKMMAQKMSIHNANYRERPFTPHLTIAFRDLKKSQFEIAWGYFKDKKYRSSCNISHLTLLQQHPGGWEPEIQFMLGSTQHR